MDSRAERIVSYGVLILFSCVVVFPIIWFVLTAVSPNSGGLIDLHSFSWSNFAAAWREAGLQRAMTASLVITVGAVACQVLFGVLTGYGFGILHAWGSKVFFPMVLLGMMISTEAIIVPLYYQFRTMGLTNSWLGLIIIQAGMGVPFGTFWMRATFRAVPGSLVEAARIDGAGALRTLGQVLLPIAKPAVYTLILLSFMWTWNDYLLGLVFIAEPSRQTATVALGVFQSRFHVETNLMAAAGIIVAAPVLILYVFFQRKFIQGVISGALKE